MLKTTWLYVVAALMIGAGGYFYYSRYHSQTTINNIEAPASTPVSTGGSVVSPELDTEAERNRKRQEGIGSIKNLKPVEIPPASDPSRH